MLDVHQLNVFLKAAETLSFTQAARLLHMTQPSVSQHIRGLEEHLGTRLFNRRGRTIALTDAGLAMVPMARELVERSVSIEESIRSLKDEVHGHLLVACSTTPGKYVLPHLLAAFHDYFPQVRVSCNVASQILALQALSTGEVHFALASTPPLTHKQIEFQHFATDEIVMIVPYDHPWAATGHVPPEALYEETFILREEGVGDAGRGSAGAERRRRQRWPAGALVDAGQLRGNRACGAGRPGHRLRFPHCGHEAGAGERGDGQD